MHKTEQHFHSKLKEASLVNTPFPHCVIPNIFPREYFNSIIDNLPPLHMYTEARNHEDYQRRCIEETGQAGDRKHLWIKKNNAHISTFSPAQKAFWDQLHSLIFSNQTLEIINSLYADSCPEVQRARGASIRLVKEREVCFIKPHKDQAFKTATMVVYLSNLESNVKAGTTLYGAASNIDKNITKEIPFISNSAHLTIRVEDSWHGAGPIRLLKDRDTLHFYFSS